MKHIYFTPLLFLVAMPCFAQIVTKSGIGRPADINMAAKKTAIVSANRINVPLALNSDDTTLFPIVVAVHPVPKVELSLSKELERYKDTARLSYTDEIPGFEPRIPAPFQIRKGFDASIGDHSAPLDNTIACSNNNFVVSTSNSFIEYYQNSSLKFKSDLSSFINYAIASPCDPKVVFDPTVNRFILFMQKCGDAIHIKSEILLAFSVSDNPLDGWNFYKLSGNPLNKTDNWFDYPKMGLTKDGLFISGNVFIGKKGSGGLDQTIVYQIDKDLGYSGQPLKYRVWYDIADKPFTIMPVSYAYNNTYGPGAFLVATTWQNNASYIKLYDITGDIYNESAAMNFYKVKTSPYNFFAESVQINQPIDNGDLRIQDAILGGQKIYYTFTSGDERNFSRVNFNVLDVPSLSNESKLLGDRVNTSYCYPSLHMLSDEGENPTVLIQYNGTSNTAYPDIRCKACDANLDCSKEIVIKAGESTINNYDRWGDYSGVAKNHVNRRQLWLSSSYGKNYSRQTYVSNIVSFDEPSIPMDSLGSGPIYSLSSIDFTANKQTDIKVVLKSDGILKTIYEGKAEKGENIFEFQTANLDEGKYSVDIFTKDSNKLIEGTTFEVR
jgi:hypothetical protein